MSEGKVYHMAKLVNPKGGVSPLCARKPRALSLKTSCWTNRPEAVTCLKCLKLITAKAGAP